MSNCPSGIGFCWTVDSWGLCRLRILLTVDLLSPTSSAIFLQLSPCLLSSMTRASFSSA